MDQPSLFIVVAKIADSRRRTRVRTLLNPWGAQLTPMAWEIPATRTELNGLRAALSPELTPEDEVRIYPVCARCRTRARAFGTTDIATLPTAWIF